MKILIIEDDPDLAELIRSGLSSNMHNPEIAHDGADGSFLARSYDYDAIILDYSLPKKDGLAVCRDIRSSGKSTPIIFLSATSDTELKVSALTQGADDYLTKPFAFTELYARIDAITRRAPTTKQVTLKIDDLTLDISRHLVKRGDKEIYLTRKEFSILEFLMSNKDTVISRALLVEHVWTADSDPFSNTVEAHIRNLRKKIRIGTTSDIIQNIPGRGYVIRTT